MGLWEFLAFTVIFGGIMTLLIVRWGLNYAREEEGLKKGATRRELEQILHEIAAIRQEIGGIQERLADITFMFHDSPSAALPRANSNRDIEKS